MGETSDASIAWSVANPAVNPSFALRMTLEEAGNLIIAGSLEAGGIWTDGTIQPQEALSEAAIPTDRMIKGRIFSTASKVKMALRFACSGVSKSS